MPEENIPDPDETAVEGAIPTAKEGLNDKSGGEAIAAPAVADDPPEGGTGSH